MREIFRNADVMHAFLRKVLSSFLLVAVMVSGQLAPCVCAVEMPETACREHDHHHDQKKPSGETGSHEQNCPCALCHQHPCPHQAVTVSAASPISPDTGDAAVRFAHEARAWSDPVCEIFIPPKVA